MKEKRTLIIGLLLGSLFGWTLGFLRLPMVEKNSSFLMGFISCMAFLSICLMLIFIWNKNALLLKLIGKTSHVTDAKNAIRTYTLLWVITAIFIGIGGSISAYLILKQNEYYKSRIQHQNEQIAQQSALMEAARNSNLTVLMDNLFDQIDEELKERPQRRLSEQTISRIAALNYSFQPYRYLMGDSLSSKKLSPERGQLLVLLASLNIDSSSFNAIKRQVSFLGADLEGAGLSGIDLSGIDLREANLRKADLSNTNLSQADLRRADLWGSKLISADLSRSDLQNAIFGWADLRGADLKAAVLNGADLKSAKLSKADLSQTTMTWADLSGAFLNETKLMAADLTWTNLRNANLSNADLKDAVMRVTNLIDVNMNKADLKGVDLTGSIILEEHWMDKLDEWQVEGAEAIKKEFDIVIDKSGLYDFRIGKASN